ncbi:MAG: LysM peptidoglycan-binding domain-containing protein [Kineosporiaceae bacterium]|nr:LysM peptidoglycan-binding domain-containing protein [Kineosporiaceae bacterium]
MMRYARAFGATLILLATLVGLPVLLALTVGNPLHGWADLVAGDLSDAVVIDVLAAVAYLAWLQYALTVIVEIVAAVAQLDVLRHVPIAPAGQRRLVHLMVATAFLLTPATTSSGTTGPPSASVTVSAPLMVPASAVAVPVRAELDDGGVSSTSYTVTKDGPGTYWDLAEHFLGDGQRWPEIWKLNDGRRQEDGAVLTSPGLLRPGWTVVLPAASPAGPNGTTAQSVTVQRGDSLWSIAEDHLGTGASWPKLFEENEGKPQPDGRRLTDPDVIQPGWVLAVPNYSDAVAVPEYPAAQPHSSSEPTAPPNASTPAGSPAPSSRPGTEPGALQNGATTPDTGVEIPGGWVSLSFAAAISAAGAMVWLRRRYRHRYAPLDDDDPLGDDLELEDADLRPLPVVIDRMRRTVRERAPHLLDPPEESRTVADYLANPTERRVSIPIPDGVDLVGLTDLIVPTGLGLTGPGADAAARALVVALVTAGGAHDVDAHGTLVIPAPTLNRLLGERTAPAEVHRLKITDDLAEALDLLDQTYLTRRRLLDEHDADDVRSLRTDPAAPPVPPMVLVTDIPPRELRARMVAVLEQGHAVEITAVLLGEWPDGATVEVRTDGHVRQGDWTGRLATFDPSTAAQLLEVAREAQPDSDPCSEEPEVEGPPRAGPISVAVPAAEVAAPGTEAPSSQAGSKIRVQLFGKIAILDTAGQPIPGLRQHAGGLLAYLAIHRRGADKNDILEALWPDAPVRRAAERLATEVGNLRRCLRQAATDQANPAVVNTGGRYHLNPDVMDVDLWAFEGNLQDARNSTDHQVGIRALERAIDTATEELCSRRDYHWLEPVREQARRAAIHAHLRLADMLSDAEPQRATTLIRAAAAMDPTNEDLAQQAIRAHVRTGDAEAIRDQLRRLRTALGNIGEALSEDTVALVENAISQSIHRPCQPANAEAENTI